MGIFHGLDEWKSAMMTLPEDVFFDLLRSVFGHVKTPFNKQNLLADLTAFLSRDDIRRNIASYIDQADAQVIAAVALLGNPGAAELEQFFAGEDVTTLLLNLEERFILYRYREGSLFRLGLNPVLEPLLKDIAENMSGIFPSLPDKEDGSGSSPVTIPPDDRFFAALISFVLDEGNIFKQEGRRADNRRAESRLRKKVLDSAGRIFPGLDPEPAIRCLLYLGLCRFVSWGSLPDCAEPPGAADTVSLGGLMPEGESLRPDDYVLGAFRDLEPRQRLIYWAAGLCLGMILPDPVPAPQLLRGKIRSLARLIGNLADLLSSSQVYPLQTLRRILFLLERETGDSSTGFSSLGQGPAPGGQPGNAASGIDAANLCTAMVQAGLLCAVPQGYRLAPLPVGPGAPDGQSAGESPALVIDAPLFCLVYPGIDFTGVLALASFTAVRETGRIFRFEITRESCLRGFEKGLNAADMEKLLTRLSGAPPESSLLWTLRDWEKRSTEVSLFEGAVLALSPERRYLAETEALGTMIRRELAPGLYLLDSGDRAAEALRKAGVDIFTRYTGQAEARSGVPLQDPPGPFTRGIRGPFPSPEKIPLGYRRTGVIMDPAVSRLSAQDHPQEFFEAPAASAKEPGDAAETLKERFRRALTNCRLAAAERNELASRIERRLVLTESQLSSASIRGEKLEARDLDYVGKASIAKQALASRFPVEVLWPAADGEQRITGIPLALEKSGGESILVMGDSRGGDASRDTVRIPLGKISLLRRIKKSMFEI
ncbi:MAG: hypothetical protein LBI94_03125 [Treponema sp.]|jgi:hypothetical protein|nr:hypothetical protein [Treponema sp.]